MAGDRKITSEEVISKLKDDGDFDRLRLKIIRKLKDNEELRNNITAVVKQSEALNRPGAETMKPRELSDIIHEEVREKVMSQISEGLWEIIRSAEGMKAEITDAVQSVYEKLDPSVKREDQPASSSHVPPAQEIKHNGPTQFSDGQPKESTDSHLQNREGRDPSPPPGFSVNEEGNDIQPDGSDDDLDVPPGFG